MRHLLYTIIIGLVCGYMIGRSICHQDAREKQEAMLVPDSIKADSIIVGGVYLHSFDWENSNPFKETNIDTATVLDIKDGYVQYSVQLLNNSVVVSSSMEVFKRIIKPLECK